MVDARIVGAVLVSLLAIATGSQSSDLDELPTDLSEVEFDEYAQYSDVFSSGGSVPRPNKSITARVEPSGRQEVSLSARKVVFSQGRVQLGDGVINSSSSQVLFRDYEGVVSTNGSVSGSASSAETSDVEFDVPVRLEDGSNNPELRFSGVEPTKITLDISSANITMNKGSTQLRGNRQMKIGSFAGNISLDSGAWVFEGRISSVDSGSFAYS
jgi:hypothetical protein